MSSAQPRYEWAVDATWVDVDDEVVVWRQGALHRLDPVAAVVWRLLAEPMRLEDLTNTLVTCYPAPPDVIAGDVERLLEVLQRKKLLELGT